MEEVMLRIVEYLFVLEDGSPLEPRLMSWLVIGFVITALITIELGYHQGHDGLFVNVIMAICLGFLATTCLLCATWIVLIFPLSVGIAVAAAVALTGLAWISHKTAMWRKWRDW